MTRSSHRAEPSCWVGIVLMNLIVVPVVVYAVVLLDKMLHGTTGTHAGDSMWLHYLSALTFYSLYAIVFGSLLSAIHGALVRRIDLGLAGRILLAAGLGVLCILPQAVVFGRAYWIFNVVAGLSSGVVYAAAIEVFIWLNSWYSNLLD